MDNNISPQDQTEIANGLKAANIFLKNTITTINKNGVSVKVNGEGYILEVQISKELSKDKLAKVVIDNINEAIQQNKEKILKNALQGLPK